MWRLLGIFFDCTRNEAYELKTSTDETNLYGANIDAYPE